MRIIHTADWHLCDRLGRHDRTDDLKTRVERVADLCDEHDADLLLIAGDLFDDRAPQEEMTDALQHLHRVFRPFLDRGGAIVAITGNHDRDSKIDLVRAGMSLVAPPVPLGGMLSTGRLYLLNRCFFCGFMSRAGERMQLVLVPFPFPYRFDLADLTYTAKEQLNRLMHDLVADWLQNVQRREDFDTSLPTVLAAHLHVRGSEVHSLHKITEREDVLFDFADLNPNWAYVALGHIHKPQTLGGQAHVRYCGSLDRLSFNETHDDHGVLLVDLGPKGLRGEPRRLPIPATPFHTIILDDPDTQLPTLAERYPARATAIVRVEATHRPEGPSRDEIQRTLKQIFPRLHELTWTNTASNGSQAASTFTPREGFAATVRDYLTRELHDDADKDALLELAETFLANGEDR